MGQQPMEVNSVIQSEGNYARKRICNRITKIVEQVKLLRDSSELIESVLEDMETELAHLQVYVNMESESVLWGVVKKEVA